jgi:UTP--glucose-1-phosphate uridylyltransferase
MRCTKAIIALAGYGTRRLPITKALEKNMMPLGNRPVIDYIVDDCIKAGITDIIFVVSEQSEQIRTYYGHNALLEGHLKEHGKEHLSEGLGKLSTKANFKFVVQDRYQLYGTTIPLWLARDLVEPDEPFLYIYGDNVYFNEDGSSSIADFLEKVEAAGTRGGVMGVEVPHELVHQYGVIVTKNKDGRELFDSIVEHPDIETAPSDINNAGCFLLWPDVFPFAERNMHQSETKERLVTDVVTWWAQAGNDCLVVHLKGEYLDCGTLEGWLHANNRIAGASKA